ncbi:hypothetical protein [Mycobacterium sp.]|uniref:hypothetical protein n=1 Tax=Mycobacterium sp. TaxID=1785 RepID=UPI001282A91C|nr:hypothetical protein [Mycobacterium sp.]KAA8958640.1 MAG: hypothetical protein F6Q13_15330 [Mycobacterium sp.]
MSELVEIDLTEDERRLMFHGLNEYSGLAKYGKPLLVPVFGASTVDEFDALVHRLRAAIENEEPLSDLDWAHALLLTEICWGSDLLGAGPEFDTNIDDENALPLLRSLQYKISNSHRRQLVIDNARYRVERL